MEKKLKDWLRKATYVAEDMSEDLYSNFGEMLLDALEHVVLKDFATEKEVNEAKRITGTHSLRGLSLYIVLTLRVEAFSTPLGYYDEA